MALDDEHIFASDDTISVSPDMNFKLSYELVETADVCGIGDSEHKCVYSILVVKSEDGAAESAFLYDISREKETALNTLELLRRNSVTPSLARQIICDIL